MKTDALPPAASPPAQCVHLRYVAARGFTMVELIVVVAIIAILVAIAVPFMGNALARNEVAGAADLLRGSLQAAKSEALGLRPSNINVMMCQVDDPAAAQPKCVTSSNWASGWVVWVDADGDGQIDPAEAIVQRVNALAISSGWAPFIAASANTFGYRSVGVPTGAQAFCISWRQVGATAAGTNARCLTVGEGGEITQTMTACSTPSC